MVNKFKEKQYQAEILNDLYQEVCRREDQIHYDYRKVGEEQAKDWRTDELRWEDEEKTIPVMRDKYENVLKADDELTEDDMMQIRVCQQIKAQLEKML